MRTIICILLISFSTLTYAQRGKDSIYSYTIDHHLIERDLLRPAFLQKDSLLSYGDIRLGYRMDKGGIRKAQQAYNTSTTTFQAHGFNQLGKFLLGAKFAFNTITEDSLSNSLRSGLEDLSPFYPYANKSGDYLRQNYLLNASLAYAMTRTIQPFLQIHYHRHWSAGTVDPRLKSDRFTLKVKPGVSFHLSKSTLGIYGIVGHADERVSIMYKNIDFKNSNLYPDQIYYMNYGYGTVRQKDSTDRNYKYDHYKGMGLQYGTQWHGWRTQVEMEYQHFHNTNQIYSKKSVLYSTPLAIYNQKNYKFFVDAAKSSAGQDQQLLSIEGEYQDGIDGNKMMSGSLDRVNYKVNTLSLAARYVKLWHKQHAVAKELSVRMAYYAENRQDLLQAIDYEIGQLHIEPSLRLYIHPVNHTTRLTQFTMAPYISMPTKTSLSYNPISMSAFIQNVVFGDYYYYKTTYLGAKVQIEHRDRFLNNNIALYGQVDFCNALNSPRLKDDVMPTFLSKGNRGRIELGIRLLL